MANGSQVTVEEKWPQGSKDYSHYSMTDMSTLYLFFLLCLPFQLGATYILKWNFVRHSLFDHSLISFPLWYKWCYILSLSLQRFDVAAACPLVCSTRWPPWCSRPSTATGTSQAHQPEAYQRLLEVKNVVELKNADGRPCVQSTPPPPCGTWPPTWLWPLRPSSQPLRSLWGEARWETFFFHKGTQSIYLKRQSSSLVERCWIFGHWRRNWGNLGGGGRAGGARGLDGSVCCGMGTSHLLLLSQ